MKELLHGLQEYRSSVSRHHHMVEEEFDVLQQSWLRFRDNFSGDAAEQFANHWEGVALFFRMYVERMHGIENHLARGIERLEQINRQSSDL